MNNDMMEIWAADTSQYGMECVRSGEILDALRPAFPRRPVRAVLQHLPPLPRHDVRPSYDRSQTLDSAIFDSVSVWAMDRHYIDTETLKPETFFGICAK